MKNGDAIKVVSIKDIGTHTDYGGRYNYYGGSLCVTGKRIDDKITFDVAKYFLIYVVDRCRYSKAEHVSFDGQKFYFELYNFENTCHYATIYDIDLLNEHFISVGDYRNHRIDEIIF